MIIYKVKIHNFRNFDHFTFNPRPGLNILIGPNNVGKSNFLKAIDLVLNPYLPWYRGYVVDKYDFHNSNTYGNIEIEIWLRCAQQKCENCSKRKLDEKLCPFIRYTSYLDIDSDEEKLIFANEMAEEINELQWATIIRMKLAANWNSDTEEVEIKHTILDPNNEEMTQTTRTMKEFVGFRLVPVDRDPLSEISFQEFSLLSKLIDKPGLYRKARKILDEAQIAEEFKEFTHNIMELYDEALSHWGGESYSSKLITFGPMFYRLLQLVKLAFGKVPTGKQMKEKIVAKPLEGEEPLGKTDLPLERHGRGFQNAVLMTTLLHYLKSESAPNLIFAIEEPEQNLEPFNQRWLLDRVRSNVGAEKQVFMTTHSTDIFVGARGLENLILATTNENGKVRFNYLSPSMLSIIGRNPDLQRDIYRALFARKVLISEGETEFAFYPTVWEGLIGRDIREGTEEKQQFEGIERWGIELINGKGSKVEEIAKLFLHANKSVLCLVDNDKLDAGERVKLLRKAAPDSSVFIIAPPKGCNFRDVLGAIIGPLPLHLQVRIILQIIYKADHRGEYYNIKYKDILNKIFQSTCGDENLILPVPDIKENREDRKIEVGISTSNLESFIDDSLKPMNRSLTTESITALLKALKLKPGMVEATRIANIFRDEVLVNPNLGYPKILETIAFLMQLFGKSLLKGVGAIYYLDGTYEFIDLDKC